MAILKKATQHKSETKIIPDEKDGILPYLESSATNADEDFEQVNSASTEDGQLALDVFQTADSIIVVAPIAGVKSKDLNISVTDEILTIKGKRNLQFRASESDYFTQECFWGNFSRSIILPESVDTSGILASFKNGVLTVRIPKVEKIRTRMVKIKEE